MYTQLFLYITTVNNVLAHKLTLFKFMEKLIFISSRLFKIKISTQNFNEYPFKNILFFINAEYSWKKIIVQRMINRFKEKH